jgi:hypothetical protein
VILHLHQVLLAGESGQVPEEDQKQRPSEEVVPTRDTAVGQEDLEVGSLPADGCHGIASMDSGV